MVKVLIVVLSGPEAEARAKEGLSIALAMREMEMADPVEVLLTGPGVKCIDAEDERCVDLREALDRVVSAGVRVAACTGSLDEHGLLDQAEQLDELKPVGAPVFLAEMADDGYAMLTF